MADRRTVCLNTNILLSNEPTTTGVVRMSEQTTTTSPVLDKMRGEIKARMDEIRPLVEEYNLLHAADQALSTGTPATPTPAPSAAKGRPGRPRGSKNRTTS